MGPYVCQVPNKTFDDYVDDGRGTNKGECVSLVKLMCSTVPSTSCWKKGPAVKGNASILRGTAIASFNPATSKYWHAAIYVSQDITGGIMVWDQYCRGVTKHPPRLNQLSWSNDSHPHVAGDNFYVID